MQKKELQFSVKFGVEPHRLQPVPSAAMSDSDDSFNQQADNNDGDDDFNGVEFNEENAEEENKGPASAKTFNTNKSSTATNLSVTRDYLILDESSIQSQLNQLVANLAESIDSTNELSSLLLRLNHWSRERVTENYFSNADSYLKKLGVDKVEYCDGYDSYKSQKESDTIECNICDDEVDFTESYSADSSHRFCKSCYRDYLQAQIHNGKASVISRCAGYKCPSIIPDIAYKSLLKPEEFAKQQHWVMRSFVEDSKNIKWCSGKNCNRAIQAVNNINSISTVVCDCGHSQCFQCAEEGHEPVKCQQLREWNQKNKNDSETAHWMIAHTKNCPKCKIRIEKNVGCNHMYCIKQSPFTCLIAWSAVLTSPPHCIDLLLLCRTCVGCKYEFCWVCDGPWSVHGVQSGGFYKCNKFDPLKARENAKAAGITEDEAKRDLHRYLHYYQRYHNHEQSKKFAGTQLQQTEKRMAQLHNTATAESLWIEVQYLYDASITVIQCRSVLKYTYVFAFYLPEGPEKILFEYLQQQLEQSTEHLSELSEKPLNEINKDAVMNYTRITRQFMENLLKGVRNGLLHDEAAKAIAS
jgi:ariadne-1